MSGSILNETKHVLGLSADDDSFDTTIIMHINTYLAHLAQLGVGPVLGFEIADETATWEDFVDQGPLLNSVKSYIALRVRNLFDPLPTGFGQQSMDRQVEEMTFRILSEMDV